MFETLTRGFKSARLKISGMAEVTEESLETALRDVRAALLEADVDYQITRDFIDRVKQKTLGEVIRTRAKSDRPGKADLALTPGDHFIKTCHDELEALLGGDAASEHADLNWKPGKEPTVVLMVGLQGSGKTTTTAKLARFAARDRHKKPLLVAADVYRPAAIDQLKTLGQRLDMPVYTDDSADPPGICERAIKEARQRGRNLVLLDTAGRLAIDDALMAELEEIRRRTKPDEVLLVIDAMIGQDAVRMAAEFHRRIPLTGLIMTKLDGDARGGAALSVKQKVGVPVKFVATGETLDKLDAFRPQGYASRILGFGDIVGLVRDFEHVVDEETAERDARKLLTGHFNFDDFMGQLRMLQSLGSLQELMEKMPFFSALPEGFQVDERAFHKFEAMIGSMTPDERQHPELMNDSRMARIAKGSGHREYEIRDMLARFNMMRRMMRQLGQDGGGFLAKLPGFSDLARLKNLGGLDFSQLFAEMGPLAQPQSPSQSQPGRGKPARNQPMQAPHPMMTPELLAELRAMQNPYANPMATPGHHAAPRPLAAAPRDTKKLEKQRKENRKAQKDARRQNRKKKK